MTPPEAQSPIGLEVVVTVDRPLGSSHPDYPEMIYKVNYGYVEGLLAADGEWQDAYILGIDGPVKSFKGKVMAVIHRRDDVETKWVVAAEGRRFSAEDIHKQTNFQEKYFDSWIES